MIIRIPVYTCVCTYIYIYIYIHALFVTFRVPKKGGRAMAPNFGRKSGLRGVHLKCDKQRVNFIQMVPNRMKSDHANKGPF